MRPQESSGATDDCCNDRTCFQVNSDLVAGSSGFDCYPRQAEPKAALIPDHFYSLAWMYHEVRRSIFSVGGVAQIRKLIFPIIRNAYEERDATFGIGAARNKFPASQSGIPGFLRKFETSICRDFGRHTAVSVIDFCSLVRIWQNSVY